jgi:hypothetical protein
MSGVIIAGNTSGSVTLDAPAVSGSTVITLPTTSGTMATLTTPSFTTTIGVGGATPSASGAGITFPATQSASADANTLDDYEEGTWTTTVGSLINITGTPTLANGTYTKIGRQTILNGTFTINVTTGSTLAYMNFTLPFTQNAANNRAGTCANDSDSKAGYVGNSGVSTVNAYLFIPSYASIAGSKTYIFSYITYD